MSIAFGLDITTSLTRDVSTERKVRMLTTSASSPRKLANFTLFKERRKATTNSCKEKSMQKCPMSSHDFLES